LTLQEKKQIRELYKTCQEKEKEHQQQQQEEEE
jgi:hypothetical protein